MDLARLQGHKVSREAANLPTPITTDYKNGKSSAGYGANLPETAKSLMPTPTTRDYKDGSQPHERDGKVQTDTVARAVFNSGEVLLGTPRANAANSSNKQVELGAPKSRLEDQVHTNWGKFEPAIRRWEAIIGRPAPEPTKPDGKDGNHRLSSKFTEWMMGLPDGWITDIGLKRNDELKACGNGVVPQQAELALSLLGIKEILER
jgi:DNA (cytosine-5)-methyltransferase 1